MPKSLPKLDPVLVDAITDMLISDQGMLRPPDKAAKLLALIVKLHELGQPFPTRADAAEHIGASVSTIDAALSTRLDEGYISQRVATRQGNVQRRNSAVRDRFYTPSKDLLRVVERVRSGKTARRA